MSIYLQHYRSLTIGIFFILSYQRVDRRCPVDNNFRDTQNRANPISSQFVHQKPCPTPPTPDLLTACHWHSPMTSHHWCPSLTNVAPLVSLSLGTYSLCLFFSFFLDLFMFLFFSCFLLFLFSSFPSLAITVAGQNCCCCYWRKSLLLLQLE